MFGSNKDVEQNMSSETDVIIIGAGASGLSAAKELTRLGLSFIVVEGSHRIGGRAYSEEIAPGVWFDLGCSYLHQGETNPFVAIADELGIVLGKDKGDLFDDSNIGFYKNGVSLNATEREAYTAYVSECFAAVTAAAERGEDVAIVDLVDLDSEFAPIFMHSMSDPLDIDEISSVDFANFDEGSDIPVLNGYGNLVAAWGSDVTVSLNTKVERINWSGAGVSVETSRGTLLGRTVLCTVSTGILASGEIEFVPGLPDWKMEAVLGLPTGTDNKICLYFDQDVFGPDGRGFHSTWNDDGVAGGFEASVMGHNTAVAFTGGRFAVWLEKQGQQAGHDYAVDRVAEAFGNDIRKHVKRSIVTAWTTEPWTRGSYSCALPGQAHQRTELALALDDRLFFAGEATTVGDHACCHGAFRSGIRAAQEIGNSFKR
jgi:monoamine oxidase